MRIKEAIKQVLPASWRPGGRQLFQRLQEIPRLSWLEHFAPRLYARVQDGRRERAIAWLRRNAHEISVALMQANVPASVRHSVIEALARERPPKRWRLARSNGGSLKADVLYVGYSKPDALKDVLALKTFAPHTRCIALALPLDMGHPARGYFDQVLEWTTHHELIRYLVSAEASVVVYRGGGDVGGVLAALGAHRFVWQARDTWLRTPRELLAPELYEIAKYLAQRADAICTFHSTEGFERLRPEVHIRGMIRTVRPGCVAQLGPSEYLPKLSASTGEPHVAYAAGVDSLGGTPHGGHGDQYLKFQQIVDQGIHLHIYSPNLQEPRRGWEPYFHLARRTKYCHLERTLHFPQLLNALTQYDWGLCHFSFNRTTLREGFQHHISNGFFTMIQARLPVICSTSTPAMAELVHRLRNGMAINDDEFPRLRTLIEHFDTQDLSHRLEEAVEATAYDHRSFGEAVFGTRGGTGQREPAAAIPVVSGRAPCT